MAGYVTVCVDLNQADEFLLPSDTVPVEYKLVHYILSMHTVDPLYHHLDSCKYVEPQFVVNNEVWARFIINPSADVSSDPNAMRFVQEMSLAYEESRPYSISVFNDDSKRMDLQFFNDYEQMDTVYMQWDRDTNPGRYEQWVTEVESSSFDLTDDVSYGQWE